MSARTGDTENAAANSAPQETLSFPDALTGLPGLVLSGQGSQAFVAQQGAQVLSWRDRQGRERLYLSPQTGGYRRGDPAGALYPPIRGGIPVSFPQFSGRGPLLKHGFARNLLWQRGLPAHGQLTGENTATFTLLDDAQSQGIWPHAFQATLSVEVQAERLHIALAITNTGQEPWSFTAALHTYLRVEDIRNTTLSGLHNLTYQDATAGNAETIQQDKELHITGEVDRVYLAPPDHLILLESGKPALRIEQQGFFDTVVWNPGPANARALKDFPDDDWLRMLCVEAACASRPVPLAPGETWQGEQVLSVLSAPT